MKKDNLLYSAVTSTVTVAIMILFIVLGFVSIPESPTYPLWIKGIVFIIVFWVVMFIGSLLLFSHEKHK